MAYIIQLGTAAAEHPIAQKDFAADVAKASKLDSKQASWLKKLYDTSQIDTRYSVLEDFANNEFWKRAPPTTAQRNALYKEHAPRLSKKACVKALQGIDPKTITHIIYVSCTGVYAPGIQAYLQETLGLKADVCQFGLNMMGCFGAFKGLQMADAFCSQNPQAIVLVVCTELCSLHFQQSDSYEQQVGNALFADASAACIVTSTIEKGYKMHRHKSHILANSSEKMTWDLTDTGLVLGLKKEVPDLLKEHIGIFTQSLLGESRVDECDWPLHPGGKGILQAVETALNLDRASTQASWDVLRQYGNISSASYLFVLDELQKQKPKKQKQDKKWAVGLGFGPGLCFEGMLLEVI